MDKRKFWSRILCIIGLAMIACWAVTSVAYLRLRGFSGFTNVFLFSLLLFPASGLVARGAFLGRSRYRRLIYCAFVLTLCGSITAFLLFAYLQSPTALPRWAFVVYVSPIGVIISCLGAVLVIIESFRKPAAPKDNVEAT
jgi:hypothetical protein